MPKDNDLGTKNLRPNYKIISSVSQPVYTSSVSINNPAMPTATEELTLAYNKLQSRFIVSSGAVNVAKGSVLVLYVTIPTDVGKTIYFDRLRAGNSDLSQIDIFVLDSAPTVTSPLTINNTFIGSSTSTKVTAGYNTTDPGIAGNLAVQTLLLTGGVNYETCYGGRVIFQIPTAALYYCVRVKNIGSGSSASMISLSWWEV